MENTNKLLWKLGQAKIDIASMKISKEGTNEFSHYDYFTPEQVNKLVQDVCNKLKIYTKFDLKRNERGLYATLTIYDLESDEHITFEGATELPEIKATNQSQRYGGLMTYMERYLKSTAFGICENSLDFDTTENTKKAVNQKSESKDITKDGPFTDLPWFNKEELEQLKAETDFLKSKATSDELIKSISTKYRISKEMKLKIADVWSEVK